MKLACAVPTSQTIIDENGDVSLLRISHIFIQVHQGDL
jgi:hypothetical protein